GVILTYITDSVGLVSVVAAWLYVALRLVHSFVHLGNNNVSLRFASFAASMMALAVLWLAMLFALV
ncbi:MAPEG family protein, partial [Oleiphilus sp. HI0086]